MRDTGQRAENVAIRGAQTRTEQNNNTATKTTYFTAVT